MLSKYHLSNSNGNRHQKRTTTVKAVNKSAHKTAQLEKYEAAVKACKGIHQPDFTVQSFDIVSHVTEWHPTHKKFLL